MNSETQILFEEAMSAVEEHLIQDTDGLWVEDSISLEETAQMRNAALTYVDEAIENVIYHAFFAESGIDNRFEPGVARILSSLGFMDPYTCLPEFITLKKILGFITGIVTEREKYDEYLNGLSYKDLVDCYKTSLDISQIRQDRRINGREYDRNENYKIIEITSFEHASQFVECFDNPDSVWECCISKDKFIEFCGDGGCIYFVLNKSYRDCVPSNGNKEIEWSDDIDYSYLEMEYPEERLPDYDRYGLSMIMVVIDQDGRLVRCSGRYGSSFEYENWLLYMDEEELSLTLGVNFYETFI